LESVPPAVANPAADAGSKVTETKPAADERAPAQNPTLALTPPSVNQTSTPAEPFDPAPPVLTKTEPPAEKIPPSPPVMVGFDPGATQVALEPPTLPPPVDSQPATKPPAQQPPPPLLATDKPETPVLPPPIPLVNATAKPDATQAEKPRTEEVVADINRDAQNEGAKRRELADLQADSLRVDPRERQAQREEIAAVARRLEAEKREPFHADLRQILKEQGRNGGREIQNLCERYGKDYPPEIFHPANRDLTGPAAHMTVPVRVDRMRRWGLPETVILGDIYEKEEVRINSPGGPRTRDEAWVFAARRLLTIPPPPAAPRPAAQPTGR
jgi:hypothetical protein